MEKYPLALVDAAYRRDLETNPRAKGLSLKEWSQLKNRETRSTKFDEGVKAGFLQRSVLNLDRPFQKAAESTGDYLRETLGDDNFVGKTVSKAGEFAVGSIPSTAMSLGSLLARTPQGRLLAGIPLGAYGMISNYNQTRDMPSAAISGATLGATPSILGKVVPKASSSLGKAVTGQAIGTAQDLIEIGVAPSADPDQNIAQRFVPNIKEFVSDPTNVAALALAELPMAGAGKVIERAARLKSERDARVAAQEGLFADKASRSNQRSILEKEYGMDIPRDVSTDKFQESINLAKGRDFSAAQTKLYEASKNLSETQKLRLKQFQQDSSDTELKFLKNLDRDPESPKPMIDETYLSFKSSKEASQFLNTELLSSKAFMSEIENFREVGNKVFYKGDNLEVLARFSKDLRRDDSRFNLDLDPRDPNTLSLENLSSVVDISKLDPRTIEFIKQQKNLLTAETLHELKKTINITEEIPTREFVQRIKDSGIPGSDFDVAIVTRFLEKVAGKETSIQLFENSQVKGLFSKEGKVQINTDTPTANIAIGNMAHEFTHAVLKDYRTKNPKGYENLVREANNYTSEEFKGLIKEANKLLDSDMDAKYLSGDMFSKSLSGYESRVAEERLAAISDIYARSKMQNKTPAFMKILPLEIQQFLLNLFDKIRSYFSPNIGIGEVFTPKSQEIFDNLVGSLEKEVYRQYKIAEEISEVVRGTDAFDKEKFGDNSQQNLKRNDRFNLSEGDDVVDHVNIVDREKLGFFERNLWSNLSLTKMYPVARELFDALHSYRGNIQRRLMQYFSDMGQNADGTKEIKQSLHDWESWIDSIAVNDSKLSRLGDLFQEDQARRKAGREIVSEQEIKDQYKFSDEDAEMILKLRQLSEKVAYQEFLDMSHRDYLNAASFLLSQTSMSKLEAEKVSQFAVQLSNELGKLDAQIKSSEDGPEKLLLERDLRIKKAQLQEKLAGELRNLDSKVSDKLVAGYTDLVDLQVRQRYDHLAATEKAGYMPMTRRGNWLIEYKTRDAQGNVEKVVDSGKSKKDAIARWKQIKKQDPNAFGEAISEKSSLESYYRHYTTGTIAEIRAQGRQELNKVLDQFDNPTEEQLETFKTIRDSYGDLDRELRDALGTKADPFRLQRKHVKGFNKFDFLPNLFDYVSVKTIIGQKGITQARAKLEMAQPEFFKNKELVDHFNQVTEYTLSAKESEWTPLRKLVYFNFLGFSVRHLMQNITQPLILGIPELSGLLASPTKAAATLPKAYAMVRSWNQKGTTGDSRIDKLFRQGEDEMVWNPSMLQHYVPGNEIEFAGQSSMKFLRGSGFGKKVNLGAAKAMKGFQNAMQVTAEMSEVFNRQVSFAMRVLSLDDKLDTQVDQENTYNEALKFVNDVNFVGDKSNRPGFIRKAGSFHGAALFSTSLMSFVINHLSLMATYVKQNFKGSVDPKTYKNRGDQFKFDNPGFWGIMMSFNMMMLFSGAMGMPFAQDADEIFESIFGIKYSEAIRTGIIKLSDLANLSEEAGDAIGDGLMNGIGSTAGVGFSDSVGLGRIFSYQTGQPFTFFDLMGAGGAVIKRGLKAGEAIAEDPLEKENWERALRRAGPAGWQYWHELSNTLKENRQLDTEGRVVSNELDPRANISRLLGFTPSAIIQERGSSFRFQRMQRKWNEEKINKARSIGRLLSDYYKTEDKSQLVKAQKSFRDFTQKRKLTLAQRESFVKSISLDVFKRSEQIINLPSVEVSNLLAEVQAANPNYQPSTLGKFRQKIGEMKVGSTLGNPVDFMKDSTMEKYAAYESLVRQGVNPTLAWTLVNERYEELRKIKELGSLNFLGL